MGHNNLPSHGSEKELSTEVRIRFDTTLVRIRQLTGLGLQQHSEMTVEVCS